MPKHRNLSSKSKLLLTNSTEIAGNKKNCLYFQKERKYKYKLNFFILNPILFILYSFFNTFHVYVQDCRVFHYFIFVKYSILKSWVSTEWHFNHFLRVFNEYRIRMFVAVSCLSFNSSFFPFFLSKF